MSDPPIAVEIARGLDPEFAFLSLFAEKRHAFWLDAGPDAPRGWSWMGEGTPEDPRQVRATTCAPPPHADEHGSPFRGGWVGWAGYDAAARRVGAPAVDDDLAPPEAWLRAEAVLAFDHVTGRAWAIGPRDAAHRLAEVTADVRTPDPVAEPAVPASVVARHRPDEYAALIEECRAAIREGDAYQLCLTTRFSVSGAVDPVEAYRRLRSLTPSHHGGFIRVGEVALLSASPERFLEVVPGEGAARVRTSPIKGTRPRGRTREEDAALATELRDSEKERAENVMIVDLMRNDLSRVCRAGTVGVDALLEVESYPAVHQLVSTVSGELEAETTVDDLLDAAFPAGSMTGAPKLSAMTILHRLERGPRGVFSGCFGWIGSDGALDLAMVIRSIVVHPGGAYVGAGGGITWRSEAAAEVAEVGVKARGPLGALGAALPPGW